MTLLTIEDRELSTYLGDGAYVRSGDYPGETLIFASNGISRTNTVFLSPGMMDTLVLYWNQRKEDLIYVSEEDK